VYPLYIIATPIGNLSDITERARELLATCNRIIAEDTRHSRILLGKLGLTPQISPYHDFNKEKVTPQLVRYLKEEGSIGLISDAGTPGIADPAFYLVREAIAENIPIVPAPGPCAAIAALVASGLPTDRFIFENFLPVKRGKRRNMLKTFIDEKRTIIVYESPNRIVKVLEDLHEIFGNISVVIAREITKMHETFHRGTPLELINFFSERKVKGECVLLFNPRIRNKSVTT